LTQIFALKFTEITLIL